MDKWEESPTLVSLEDININDAWMFPELTKLGKFLVTLSLLNIYKNGLYQDRLGPALWCYTTNYYMGRIPRSKTDFK
jgi:hypothetical protein